MNKDIVYIISLILIIINCIIYKKTILPKYKKNIIFKLILLLCIMIVLHYNIYIGFVLSTTYLIINNKH